MKAFLLIHTTTKDDSLCVNLVAKVADVSISDVSSSSLELLDCRKLILHYPNPPEAQKAEARTLLIKTH